MQKLNRIHLLTMGRRLGYGAGGVGGLDHAHGDTSGNVTAVGDWGYYGAGAVSAGAVGGRGAAWPSGRPSPPFQPRLDRFM